MSEENTFKSKRDLMWEQKKKMREEKIKSTYDPPQEYSKKSNNETNYSNPNIQSNENIPGCFPEPKQNNNQIQNYNQNIYNQFSNDNLKQPASLPSNVNIIHNEPNINFVIKPNNEFYQKPNSSIGNMQRKNEMDELAQKISGNGHFQDSNNINHNHKSLSPILPIEDPNALNKVIKKEYGDFLKNQMKEKEDRKVGFSIQDKKEQLQSLMENQNYNPFGKPGGGGPNKKAAYTNPNINDNNKNNRNNIFNNKMQNNRQVDFEDGQNYFQPNDYNSLMQNNLQNLQREKMKMINYKNFINQNANNYNNYDRNQNQNQGMMNQYDFNQDYQQNPENINYFQPQQQTPFNPNQFHINNNAPNNIYNAPNKFEDMNNNYKQQQNNEGNNKNIQNFNSKPQNIEKNENDQKNIIFMNNENINNMIPSVKKRTGRNCLMYENMGDNELVKKEAKAQEMQKALLEQIEVKKRQKDFEKEKQRIEEQAEEVRLQKEREQMELDIRQEEEKKKAKLEKVRQDNLDLKEDKFFKKAPSNNNAVSKDISATNLVQTPFILRTDVSKEFLEQEGKNSRKNVRNPRPKNMININNKGITENMVASIQNQNQNLNYNIFSHDQNSNNHGNDALDIQMQRENEIQSIKNDAKNQQKNMQQKLFEIQNEAANAIKMKNQAEQELLNLRQVLKEKVLEEEKYKQNLLLALNKNDPSKKSNNRTFYPQQNFNSSDNNSIINSNNLNYNNNFNNTKNNVPDLSNFKRNTSELNNAAKVFSLDNVREIKNNLIKPLKIFERGGVTSGKDVFQEAAMGDRTLISDTKMIPLDILDQYAKNHDTNNPLTFSKIGNLAMRPNSSNMLENSNRYENIFETKQADISNQSGRSFIIKKRPYSHKNQRYDRHSSDNNNLEQSVNSKITTEIDNILKSHQNELNNNKIHTFNKVAKGILESPHFENMNYNEVGGIKLDSEFPTLKDQSMYSMKSVVVKNGRENDHPDVVEKILKNQQKQNNNNYNKYEDTYKDQTLYSTLNIDEVNIRNDERLKEIIMMEKYIDGGSKNKNNLNIISEEDEISKLDKLIKNF